MAKEVYAVTRKRKQSFTDFGGLNKAQVISKHLSLEDANNAAEEIAEEACLFAWFPRGIKRERSINEHGGLKIDCKMNPMEEFDTHITVAVEKQSTDQIASSDVTAENNLLKKNSKGYKITIPYGRPGGLRRGDRIAKFTFCGTLKSMSRREAQHAVDVYGGKVVNTFGYADFAVVGSKAIKYELAYLRQGKAEFLDEAAFYELLKNGVPKEKYLKDIKFDALGHYAGGSDAEKYDLEHADIAYYSDSMPTSDDDDQESRGRPRKKRRT